MRIGIISTMDATPWGGSEELWAAMAHRALQTGIHVSVCLVRPNPHHEKWEALEKEGADLFCDPSSGWHFRACSFARRAGALSYRLGRYLRESLWPLRRFFATQPDVLLVSDGASIPRSDLLDAIREHFASKPYVILSQSNVGEIPQTEDRKRAVSFYCGARSALFVSENNLRATERQLLQKLSNARVVRNPVNLDCIDPVDWPKEDTVSLASIARLVAAAKGQDILLEVLSDQLWRDRDWRLSIYGSGRDAEYLQGLCVYYGLSDRVSFRGQDENIRRIWQAHHALVLPSRVEGTPLVLVEAMLCGRPVIGTAVAGIPEWIQNGRNGFVADAPTVNSYAAALEGAWRRRTEWQAMGGNARQDALLLYDPTPADTLLSIVMKAVHVNQRGCHSAMEE